MKIAVLSDIHGNYVAFKECVKEAKERNVDAFAFLGDYVGEFPFPQKTMELLYDLKKEQKCYFVRGNKEDYWINHRKNNVDDWKLETSSTGALQYTYMNLSEKDIDFFEAMPHCIDITVEGMETILICHGSPNKNNEKMFPIRENTEKIVSECNYKYILCGHTHAQEVYECNGKLLINAGSVGAALHSKGQAGFLILTSNNEKWNYEFVNLEYDKEQIINDMEKADLYRLAPYWTKITQHLVMTGELSHGTVLAKAMDYCFKEEGACVWNNVPEKYWKRAVEELKKL